MTHSTLFKRLILILLVVFTTVEGYKSFKSLVSDSLIEITDFAETSQETEQKEGKSLDEILVNLYTETIIDFYSTTYSVDASENYSLVYRTIPTPPPN